MTPIQYNHVNITKISWFLANNFLRKMDALEKMIHEELPQLLKLTTEEAASAEAASMAQLGTGASPFAVMKVDGKSERTVYQESTTRGENNSKKRGKAKKLVKVDPLMFWDDVI